MYLIAIQTKCNEIYKHYELLNYIHTGHVSTVYVYII